MAKVSKNNLFEDFSPSSKAEWKEKTEAGLKGKSIDSLTWSPESSLKIEPYYTREEIANLSSQYNHHPGIPPFSRGNDLNGSRNDWQLVEEIYHTGNQAFLANIQSGIGQEVQAFSIQFDHFSQQEIREIFAKNISLNRQAIHLKTSSSPSLALVELYLSTSSKGIPPRNLTGTLTHDPISSAVRRGKKVSDVAMVECEGGMVNSRKSPHFRALGLDMTYVHQMGGNQVQEIAFTLATLVDYLDYYDELGSDLKEEEIFANVAIRFSTGPSFFLELAKLRAFRILYNRVAEVMQVKHSDFRSPFIISQTSDWHISKYDRHNNLLRFTTEAVSAIAGGTNALIVSAYDPDEDDFSESVRLGRNIQHLLKYESYLNQVADPAGGAYYVEQITDQLCEAAWAMFQQIEKIGGMIKAVDSGLIKSLLADAKETVKEELAFRRKIVVGVNHFPGVEKSIPPTDDTVPNIGEDFEAIRRKVDFQEEKGGRPVAFLFTFGNLKMRNTRLQFAQNLLATAGLGIQTNSLAEDRTQSLAELTDSKAEVIILCASDEDYDQEGKNLIEDIQKSLPKAKIYIAGKSSVLSEPEIDGSIFQGMNALAFLEKLTQTFSY